MISTSLPTAFAERILFFPYPDHSLFDESEKAMKVSRHLALSAGISVLLYRLTQNRRAAVSSFLAGVFWDLDHVADYVIQYGIPWNLGVFFRRFYKREIPRVVLLLHSWEIVALLVGFTGLRLNSFLKGKDQGKSATTRIPWALVGIVVGALSHLLSDQIVNKPRPRAYFFVSRLRRGFMHHKLFSKAADS